MRRLALLIGIVAWATGCGDQPPPASLPAPTPETAQLTCARGFSYSDDRTHFREGWRERAVSAGPVTFLHMNAMGDADLARRRALLVKALVEPHAPATTIAVSPEDRDHVSLSPQVPTDPFEPPEGDPALRMEGCEPRTDDSVEGEQLGTGYEFAVVADGPRCATFEITPEGGETARRQVGLGVRECPKPVEMTCGAAGWTYHADKRYFQGNWREEAVIAGPITLLWLNTHAAGEFSRPRALYTKVLLRPRATTTVAIAAEDRDWVRLASQPPNDEYAAAGGDPAIEFEGCPPRPAPVRGTGYAIAVMVDRPGCATFEITPKGGATRRRQVAFGRKDCR